MKTKSSIQIVAARWMQPFAWALALGLCTCTSRGAEPAAPASELLEKGIYTEETKGELKAATEIYRQIVEDPRAERSVAAQAQLRLGLCQLKLGNKPQAISALDQLTREFPDKDKLLAIVEQHMPQVLDEIVREIERDYIQEVDRGELMETAIRAIVGKLDGRSGLLRTNDMEFYGANELAQVNEQLDQKLAGIGAMLKFNDGHVVVQSPLPGSPAFAGGLRAGDRIATINGTELPPAKPIETAVKQLRGPVGTAVTVGVQRGDSDEVRELQLTRNLIRLPSVLGDRRQADNTWDFMWDDHKKIGYIRLTYIGRQSSEEMRDALEDLKERGLKALVLDLRNDPGGLLDGAAAIADLFVEQGRIVTVKGRHDETVYDARPEGTFTGFPMALLVNRKTTSAAEIVAACLQDHQRAVVVGERTFGQGIVRSILHLKNGMGAVKLPVAAYYRPNGKSMNRYPGSADSDDWGVTPDDGYEVTLTEDELKQYETARAARDVLTTEPAANSALPDRPMQRALEWIQARLDRPAAAPASPSPKP